MNTVMVGFLPWTDTCSTCFLSLISLIVWQVKTPFESKVLAKLRPVQLIGGSKTLFIVSQDGKVRP